jgi:hypothetical protein
VGTPWKDVGARIAAFNDSHSNVFVTDDEFARRVFGSPSYRQLQIAVILRRVIAGECHVLPEALDANEEIAGILGMMGPLDRISSLLLKPYGYDWDAVFVAMQFQLQSLFNKRVNWQLSEARVLTSFGGERCRELGCALFGGWVRLATDEILARWLRDE